MTRQVRTWAMALVAVSSIGLVSGCSAGTDKAGGKAAGKAVTLRLATSLGETEELDGFAHLVSRLSNGTLRIDVRSNWRRGEPAAENGLIADVRAGEVELGAAGSRAWDSVGVSGLRALAAPLLIDSYALEARVVRNPMIASMLEGLRPLGLVGLAVLPGPLRRPLGITRPLLGPGDYAGLRIGVQQSRVASATMRALGATPVWFAGGAPITGFDGIEQHLYSIYGNQYDRAGEYLTANVVLWPRPLVLFASAKALAALTPVQRGILRSAAAADVRPETVVVRNEEHESASTLCRAHRVRFVVASDRDLAALRKAVEPVYEQLRREPRTARYLARIAALRREGDAAYVLPACSAPTPGRAVGATPIDGVWHMVTKVGDEPSDPRPVAENYGDWVFVFDRGRFAITQEYEDACTWGYGRYTVHGHRMAWSFTDGGGIAPNDAMNKPGEFFRFGWSRYRDSLEVTPVAGAISPVNFRGKPWRRLSTKPSPRYLSKRCPPPAAALPP
jgi:TRAP-type C4-dicarboxylate transport system substrate-binding protein